MRRAAKVDANHAAIVATFRAHGAAVLDLSGVGNGCPDALVTVTGRYNEMVYALVEIKDGSLSPSHRKLTPAQKAFHASWPDVIPIVTSEEDAERLVGRLRGW